MQPIRKVARARDRFHVSPRFSSFCPISKRQHAVRQYVFLVVSLDRTGFHRDSRIRPFRPNSISTCVAFRNYAITYAITYAWSSFHVIFRFLRIAGNSWIRVVQQQRWNVIARGRQLRSKKNDIHASCESLETRNTQVRRSMADRRR